MKEQNSNRTLIVTDPKSATILRDPKQLSFIAPFLGNACTIGEVARKLDGEPSTMYRRVQRYIELGLLELAFEKQRSGKTTKFYQTSAEAFFIPNHVVKNSAVKKINWYSYWERVLSSSVEYGVNEATENWGTEIFRNEEGLLKISAARSPGKLIDFLNKDEPALLNAFHDTFYLDFEDAKEMQRELYTVWQKYMGKRGAQRYIVRLALVPTRESTEKIL